MFKKYFEVPFVVSVNVDVKERKDEEKMTKKSIPNNCDAQNDYKFIRVSDNCGFCVRKDEVDLVQGFDMLDAKIFRVMRPLYGPVGASQIVKHLNPEQKKEYRALFINMEMELLGQKASEGFKYIEPLRSTKHIIGSIEDNKPFEPMYDDKDIIEDIKQIIKFYNKGFSQITEILKKQTFVLNKMDENFNALKSRLKSIDRRAGSTFKISADTYTMLEQMRSEIDTCQIEDLIDTIQEFINWKKRQERGTQSCSCSCKK